MEGTFEDVARVISDQRFRNAIDNDPTPSQDIKLPKSVDPLLFIEEKGITLSSLLREPLGRFFLQKFADIKVTPLNSEHQENTDTETSAENVIPNSYSRDVSGFQHSILKFTADWTDLMKRDSAGFVPLVDLLLMIEQHDLVEFFNEAMTSFQTNRDLEAAAKDHKITTSDELNSSNIEIVQLPPTAPVTADRETNFEFESLKEQIQQEQDAEEPPSPMQNDTLRSSTSLALGSRNLRNNAGETESDKSFTKLRLSKPPSSLASGRSTKVVQSGRLTTMKSSTELYTQHSLSDNSYDTGDEREALNFEFVNYKNHSMRTRDINDRIERKIKAELQPLFDKLCADEKMLKEYVKFKNWSMTQIQNNQIQYHRILGQGAFGSVFGCTIKQVGVVMAMKVMGKRRIKMKRAKNQVEAEHNTLKALSEHPSPYCMHLRYAYETKESYHLILPLAKGGDLKFHLRDKGIDLQRARIYAAEIAFGLGHLHELGFIMRDLKPRNVLLDDKGHCKISDFGLAIRINKDVHKGKAGTEGYWSPEVISAKDYAYDCDWWSYGCVLFELVAGINPFSSKHTGFDTRNEGTLSGKIKYTDGFDPAAKDLVSRLLTLDFKNRMCTTRNGIHDLMKQAHPFWSPIELAAVRLGLSPSLWKPEKGKIYAEKQQEIAEHDYNDRRVKLLKGDEIPFPYYVDQTLHQNDLVQIIPQHSKDPMITKNEWTDFERIIVPRGSLCCTIF